MDTESMSILERREMYDRLIKRKSEEKEANEKAIKDAQNKGGNNRSGGKRRRR